MNREQPVGLHDVCLHRLWAQSYAVPRPHPYRASDETQAPSDYLSILDRCLQYIPYISPDQALATLSHSDLHLDNIFVERDTMNITCIIDWQSSIISEPYFQHKLPPVLTTIDAIIENDGDTGDEAKTEVEAFLERLPRLISHYETLKEEKSPEKWKALNHANRHFLTDVVPSITGSWTRDNGFRLLNSLIATCEDWEGIAAQGIPCPLQFTEDEVDCHQRDLDVVTNLARVLEQLEQAGVIPNGGKVPSDELERALDASRKLKAWFISEDKAGEDRDLNAKIWPYRTE